MTGIYNINKRSIKFLQDIKKCGR